MEHAQRPTDEHLDRQHLEESDHSIPPPALLSRFISGTRFP